MLMYNSETSILQRGQASKWELLKKGFHPDSYGDQNLFEDTPPDICNLILMDFLGAGSPRFVRTSFLASYLMLVSFSPKKKKFEGMNNNNNNNSKEVETYTTLGAVHRWSICQKVYSISICCHYKNRKEKGNYEIYKTCRIKN